ncbi:MAG TPA: glycoside hydrolase domain-containing protein [Streptosporangiaceae bacterium]|nr:glycoside hydrolase domain-containing protein [Streptosporangiaceae bacterium]
MARARSSAAITASVAAAASAMLLLAAAPALAAPATTVSYPSSASATRYSGLAFDACDAPSLTAMQAWSASPYRGIGVYVGGVNRTCKLQPELTPGWVVAVSELGWRLLPIYKGLQPPCGGKPTDHKISLTPATATSQGTSAANEAAASASALGMRKGSAIYNDIENYSASTACRTAVLTYLSAWTKRLHRLGYVSGVYANLSSGAPDLSRVYGSASYARPDALWMARYDQNPSLTGWAGIPDSRWPVYQRAKQYRGGHDETYGGVTLTIDNDNVSAPVATVTFQYSVTGGSSVRGRSGPGYSYPVVKTYSPGTTLRVLCQARGDRFGTTRVWDKLRDGTYVTDYRVSTPSNTGFSGQATRCMYPYQVIPGTGINERAGAGRSYPVAGHLDGGALAWVTCQAAGSKVGTTRVWDKLQDGRWVSDYYVATPSHTTFSGPAPRC